MRKYGEGLSRTREPGESVAAVDDPAPRVKLVYLLRGDTVYGRYEKTVESGIREPATPVKNL